MHGAVLTTEQHQNSISDMLFSSVARDRPMYLPKNMAMSRRSSRLRRKHTSVHSDEPKTTPTKAPSTNARPSKRRRTANHSRTAFPEPKDWRAVHERIVLMRTEGIAAEAPVDTMGCEMLATSTDPKTFRFQTLVSLMLSSMTKDQTTAAAMASLQSHWSDGLTVSNVVSATEQEIDSCICKVGFHKRKSNYIKQTAHILQHKFNGDIPSTVTELCELPGVGPKMAFLAMQSAWHNPVGIGVDVHVARISGRLGWSDSNTPEGTRQDLEDWLPKDMWGTINKLLVGFGQTVCKAQRPKCDSCQV